MLTSAISASNNVDASAPAIRATNVRWLGVHECVPAVDQLPVVFQLAVTLDTQYRNPVSAAVVNTQFQLLPKSVLLVFRTSSLMPAAAFESITRTRLNAALDPE